MRVDMMLCTRFSFLLIVTSFGDALSNTAFGNQKHSKDIELFESLAYKYGTDKSKDDHNYVDVYSSLFSFTRHLVKNMTEIGVMAGQSLQVWHDYFPNAIINGIDLWYPKGVVDNLRLLPRIKLYATNCVDSTSTAKLNFEVESMDIIIDDGPHERHNQERTLQNWWRSEKLTCVCFFSY